MINIQKLYQNEKQLLKYLITEEKNLRSNYQKKITELIHEILETKEKIEFLEKIK